MALNKVVVLVLVLALSMSILVAGDVTYDGRALIINGTRRMLFSGSIHYPRSTPEMWPYLIAKAKYGGLDVIQTYVFWNVHEPVEGQYNFQWRYNLVQFIKEVQAQGLYVSLRLGPFIQAEWDYGGLPFWLHDIPGIVFRSDNEPFKFYMEKFVSMIVNMMKSEKLYYPQGGPIILSQIENEYKNVEGAFHEAGPPYVRWAASMAVGLQTGVPWVMCKQDDAPDPVINTCNGLTCGETFAGPNSPEKPALWTENWTLRYPQYGKDPPSGRHPNELAFAVALFVAKKFGSFVNYYMYHGGTNFGRSASAYVTTSYYDQSPLDEYGLIWLPTWGHLRELHTVIKRSSEPLLWGKYTSTTLGKQQEAHVFETSKKCIAFLVNFAGQATKEFRNVTYELPSKSISILSDCKTVAFNTAEVNAQSGKRSATVVQRLNNAGTWSAFVDTVPTVYDASIRNYELLEQLSTTKDATDYLWYTFSYNYNPSDGQQVLHVNSKAHVLHAFVNHNFVGSAHGSSDRQLAFEQNILLKEGQNNISLLSVMVGFPDSGAYLEKRTAGLNGVGIYPCGSKHQNFTNLLWGYQIGLSGEKLGIQTQNGSANVNWSCVERSTSKRLTWYKTTFDAPMGNHPVALNLSSMGKGEVWINGESIGRYWVSFKSPSGQSSQTLYHVPRSFLQPCGNLLVLFEEMDGDPLGITVNIISVTTVCSKVAESSPSQFSKIEQPSFQLQCHEGQAISSIKFASYGNPLGLCENYALGSCHSDLSKAVIEKACVGERNCSIPVSAETFGGDPCPDIAKSLLVVADCI